MAKRFKDYVGMLQRLKSGQRVFDSSLYKWKEVEPEEKGERRVLHGLCGACMQHDCATLLHLEDGIVVKIEGNPEAPPNYGSLCARGNSEIMSLYNPYRVKTPLVRTNPERGLDVDPMWKEVTWDEALDLVSERFKQIREKDPIEAAKLSLRLLEYIVPKQKSVEMRAEIDQRIQQITVNINRSGSEEPNN